MICGFLNILPGVPRSWRRNWADWWLVLLKSELDSIRGQVRPHCFFDSSTAWPFSVQPHHRVFDLAAQECTVVTSIFYFTVSGRLAPIGS